MSTDKLSERIDAALADHLKLDEGTQVACLTTAQRNRDARIAVIDGVLAPHLQAVADLRAASQAIVAESNAKDAELERLRQAVGLATTAVPSMEMDVDNPIGMMQRVVDETERLRAEQGCLMAGPGRGDCEHFIGLPEREDETTANEYGRPHGWCEVCWRGEQIRRLRKALADCDRREQGGDGK